MFKPRRTSRGDLIVLSPGKSLSCGRYEQPDLVAKLDGEVLEFLKIRLHIAEVPGAAFVLKSEGRLERRTEPHHTDCAF